MAGKIKHMLVVGLLLCGISGGAVRGEMISSQSSRPPQKPPSQSSMAGSEGVDSASQLSEDGFSLVGAEYLIGPEDVLEITVWQNQDLSKVVTVRPDGRISLPLINDVRAAGKTPARLTKELSALLRVYVENPSVSVIAKEVNSYQIFLLGEVAKPGRYPIKIKTSLLQAIAISGGFTQTAARDRLVIYRLGKKGEKLKINYDDIVFRDDIQQNIELMPGDVIFVPSLKTIMQ